LKGRQAVPNHGPVPGRKGIEERIGRRLCRRSGRRRGNFSDGEVQGSDIAFAGKLIEIAEDLLLHELELMQPYRR